ncbi:hypothetical protein HYC85_000017 [Camellia sinensis]|uniref:Protein kinase domain-containing protein n=1 Tax=Camellia sinensis TaxID=4442 RepID=A0A7J7FSR4_CAMSI|nr:hypothetical protein HYC85_000017 [Camellia sinensis]
MKLKIIKPNISSSHQIKQPLATSKGHLQISNIYMHMLIFCTQCMEKGTDLLQWWIGGEEGANPESTLDFLAKHCQWAVVTLGPNGCIAKHGKEIVRVPAIGEAKAIDATGAEDLFASGFLYGLVRQAQHQHYVADAQRQHIKLLCKKEAPTRPHHPKYLHHEVTPHIIHRDIKASNVLLDSNFEPLVADFGFAKLIPEGVSHMTTHVKGTLGYLAPEYAMWGKPIEKLLGGVKRTITEWAEPLILKGRFKELVDPKLRGNFDENQLKQGIHVAALCMQSEAEKRPTMKEVVGLLKGYDPKSEEKQLRIESIRYEEGLMAKNQDSDDENGGGSPYDESSASYGVFGAMDVQKMQDPYKQYGDKRIAKHG